MNVKHIIQTTQKYKLEIVSFLSGAIVLTFELVASRIVAPYLGTTIYIWTSIIGAVLAGLAVGYTLGGYLADRRHRTADVMLLLVGATAFMLIVNIVKDPLLGFVSSKTWPLQLQTFITSIALFMPPTVLLGAIPPYLARLSLVDLATSGKHIARINAAGTIGSLMGTFVTGYVLFGYVGSRSILAILSLCLLLTSFLLVQKGWLLARFILGVFALLLLFSPPALHIYDVTVYKDVDTFYGRYVIGDVTVNQQPTRVLQADENDWESITYLNGNKNLIFPYTQEFADVAKVVPDTQSMLMVGGGTFTVPEFLANLKPSSRVDAVEIDGQLISLSKKYFAFHQSPNLHIIQADGRQFLNHNTRQYNLVFLDAFSGGVPPFQLLTKEATQRINTSLAPGGTVVMNIVAHRTGNGAALAASVAKTYEQVFAHVAVYPVEAQLSPSTQQNLLLLASQKPLPVSTFEKITTDSNFRSSLTHPVNFNPHLGIVLTDDYAPVERLLADY
jgi:spermidine synthase